jgi:hypothetical protein
MQSIDGYQKPLLDVTDPLDQLVDRAEKYLAGEPSLYQKAGELVSIARDNQGRFGLKPVRSTVVRYLLSRVIRWVNEDKSIHPPTSVAKCILDKNTWHNIRPLRAMATFPPMAANGSINTTEGYHPDTHVFFTGNINCHIPDRPTQEDARQAAATLLDIVCDFPFAEEGHKSAWVAGLLSPLSRFAHDGNMPMVVVQANGPRVGKTSLVKLISYIISGNECPVVTNTKNEDETRKRILSYLRLGRSMVLVDNVVGEYGGASINAMATSRMWEDRVLGSSKVLQVQNDTAWFITGNNILLAPDTAERCLNIRLLSLEEKPHLRTGFKYPDLWEAVRERRPELLSSALCILKGYIMAGMPDMKLPKWGSFEQWSKLVRGAIVWAGLPDPATTRQELEAEADVGRHAANSLLEGWSQLQDEVGVHDGITTRQVYDFLMNGTRAPILRNALEEVAGGVGKLPNAHTIGRHLREIKDRNFNGKCLSCAPNEKTGHRWFVSQVNGKGTGGHGGQDSQGFSQSKTKPGPFLA